MKQTFLFFFFFYAVHMAAQHPDAKRDYVWRTGYNSWFPYRFNTSLDFNVHPTKVDSLYKKHPNDGQVGMICNTGGDFLLFSNGCLIATKSDSVIPNTQKMNAGIIHDGYCPPLGDGMVHPQSMIVLPFPNDTNSFAFFHSNMTITPDVYIDRLLLTKVDKSNAQRFQAVFVDSLLIKDYLEGAHLTACRHANGRDWWILQPQEGTNRYYTLFFGANRFKIDTQSLGVASFRRENTSGQAVFSPDGTKYVRYNHRSDLRIFDFNRCTGQLSNPIHIPIQDAADSVGFAGCAISANSRYLYVISTDKIYQFDLNASNIALSKMTVLTYDGAESRGGLRYTFAQGQLGADGKIYVSNTGGRDALHLIEAPDSAGLACRAVQRRYRLLESISYALPYFPNFRLGALRGSPCDTLTTTQEISNLGGYGMKFFPNPATDMLNIDVTMPDFDQANATIEIHDVLGNQVYHAPLSPFTSIHNVDVSFLANGVYLVSLQINGKMKTIRKVTIFH
jgi:hypothetical protein